MRGGVASLLHGLGSGGSSSRGERLVTPNMDTFISSSFRVTRSSSLVVGAQGTSNSYGFIMSVLVNVSKSLVE